MKRQATPKEVEAVRRLRLPGVEFVAESKRFYPNRTLGAHVLGFTGMDGKGMEGIEFFHDGYLRGTGTSVRILKDAYGNGFQSEPPPDEEGAGKNLVLTIDQAVQFVTETAIGEAVESTRARSGMALVMEPATGAILALALAPTFNPNAREDQKKALWRNRAVTDPFEPGSTLKIFVAAAALEHTQLSPKTTFNCENGAYKIGKYTVHDVHRYGVLSLQDIIRFSSNIGAAKIGEKVGPERLHQTLRLFGFGQRTGIDSPSETAGLLMPPKRWADIDTAAISFGHGISVSAVQLVAAVSAIANDGVLMRPRLVQAVTDRQGQIVQQFPPEEVHRAVSVQTARTVRDIMQTVMLPGGTGVSASLEGYTACGKTGTARKVDESGQYTNDRHVASFVGFAPYRKTPDRGADRDRRAQGADLRRRRGGPGLPQDRPGHPELPERAAAHRHREAAGVHGRGGARMTRLAALLSATGDDGRVGGRRRWARGALAALPLPGGAPRRGVRGHAGDERRRARLRRDAVDRGAVAVVVERPVAARVAVVQVPDSRRALAELAAAFYGRPSEDMTVVAVTGTNGKTTTSYLIESILAQAGHRTGVIGTINYRFAGQSFANPVTTPESLDLQRILADMRAAGVGHAVLEASSHAIHLARIHACHVDVAVFTNLSQDHLDYHGDMQTYWAVKQSALHRPPPLGPQSGTRHGRRQHRQRARPRAGRPAGRAQTMRVGTTADCDLRGEDIACCARRDPGGHPPGGRPHRVRLPARRPPQRREHPVCGRRRRGPRDRPRGGGPGDRGARLRSGPARTGRQPRAGSASTSTTPTPRTRSKTRCGRCGRSRPGA